MKKPGGGQSPGFIRGYKCQEGDRIALNTILIGTISLCQVSWFYQSFVYKIHNKGIEGKLNVPPR